MPVLLDLSRGAGAQIARDLREQRPGVVLFAVVDNRRPDLTTEAVLTGVADVFAGTRRATSLERDRGVRCATISRQRVTRAADSLYGQSPSMRDVTTLISRAASMRAGVTIRGEDGTGRQVVARAIHTAQADSAEFVEIDCAASGRRSRDELFEVRGCDPATAATLTGWRKSAGRAGCIRRWAGRSISRTSPKRRRACRAVWRGCSGIAKPSGRDRTNDRV